MGQEYAELDEDGQKWPILGRKLEVAAFDLSSTVSQKR